MLNLFGVLKGLLVQGEVDRTKQIAIEVDETAADTNTKTTLRSGHTTVNRELSLPDADGEIVEKDVSQTITNKDLTGNTNIVTGTRAENFERPGNNQVINVPDVTASDEFTTNSHPQTLENKTIDGDAPNTFANIPVTAFKTDPSAPDTFISRDNAGVIISTKAVPAGEVLGDTDVQTITNKSVDADNNTITNIDNDEIKALAGIEATKIADRVIVSIY
jgi:hypothetical protein